MLKFSEAYLLREIAGQVGTIVTPQLALFSAISGDPFNGGTLTECTYSGYARATITWGTAYPFSDGSVGYSLFESFPSVTSGFTLADTAIGCALYDGATLLAYDIWDQSRPITGANQTIDCVFNYRDQQANDHGTSFPI